MKNKLFLAAIPFLALNGFFVANMEVYPELKRVADRPELVVVSSVFVLVFALPSFLALVRWIGLRHGLLALLVLGAFAVGIETFAVKTGVPYGRFSYGPKIGAKVFDAVPWTVPFAWTPLLLGAYALAHRFQTRFALKSEYSILVLCTLIITAFDLVLDPGAVSQKFWTCEAGGLYYGVPLSNYFGWLLSGAIGSWMLHTFVKQSQLDKELPPTNLLGSVFLILLFWTSVCTWSALWIPAFIGFVLLIFVGKIFFS